MRYNDLDHAVDNCLKLLRRVGKDETIFFAKTDVRSAFRLIGISPEDFCWLILMAEHPTTNERWYFVDKCLPFGASISCAIFQAFSDSLAHILRVWTQRAGQDPDCLTNYLDDFLFLSYMKSLCDELVKRFLTICEMVRCPIAEEKTEWGNQFMTFLGILLDGRSHLLAIPEAKRIKTANLLKGILSRKTATIKDIQRIAGSLNFLCRAIFVGRAFVRRFYDKLTAKTGVQLKDHHHIRVDNELKEDCRVWLKFLSTESTAVLNRPFVDLHRFQTSETLNFYTDSSANTELGFGCVFGNRWFFGRWEPGFVDKYSPSIEYLELAALCMAVLTWTNLLRNTRIVIFCDNQAVVQMVNNNTSRCPNCMILLRKLIADGLIQNRRVFVKWVSTKSNKLADSLSRGKIGLFCRLAPNMRQYPDVISTDIWLLSRIWKCL